MSKKRLTNSGTISDQSDLSQKESISSVSSQQFQSEPSQTSEILPLQDVLQFDFSFGYDCKQHFNLCVVDENVLIYYSGTFIHIYYLDTQSFEFRRSYSKSGIGHIVKNPKESHLAVGEKCVNPQIVIYEWPTFNILSKMAGGTSRAFSHLGYSGDGNMLVSQGKEPDYTISVWDWRHAQIILRVKSHGQDVFNAEFSQFVPGQLTTSGLGHIKFWKMARTFTGLKLQGELGRFGKTEICDILGMCAMPDEKVISGSEWGNLLVWEDRLIKLEVRQKAKGNCHNAAISQIHFDANTHDIISVGMDGWIKLWTCTTIDAADPPDEEDWCLEMQPSFELHVKDELGEAKLMSLCKKNSDPSDVQWFGQDADGGIWAVSLHADGGQPHRVLTCHAGSVADMAASPLAHYLATLGTNGSLLVHDVVKKELLLSHRFKAPGCSLVWIPTHVEASGSVLIGGFGDGVLRMFVVSLSEFQRAKNTQKLQKKSSLAFKKPIEYINIIQRMKPHSASVTALCLNPRGSILVSASQDKTIFIHQILPKMEYIALVPIGFVELAAPITFITWMPKKNATAIVACEDGSLSEIVLPERPLSEVCASYSLTVESRMLLFKSVKSELLRAEELREIERKKQEKRDRKIFELEKVKTDNPNLDIDENLFLMDSDEELEFPPLYYPDQPSPVLFVIVKPDGNLLLSMGGYDCGYLYQYQMGTSGPIHSHPVPDTLNIQMQCFLPICDDQFVVFGMANGMLRLVSCVNSQPDFTNYFDLAMHDPENGKVCRLCTSFDGKYLYSCGTDGNFFTYRLNLDEFLLQQKLSEESRTKRLSRNISFISGSIPKEVVVDLRGDHELSLEETKKNFESLLHEKLANERKEEVRKKLFRLKLRFEDTIYRNELLPLSQVLPHSEFELDPRIAAALKTKIENERNLMLRKIAFKVARSRMLVKKMQNHFVDRIASLDVTVRAIKNEDLRIKAFTHNHLTTEFLRDESEMQAKVFAKSVISSVTFQPSSRGTASIATAPRQSIIESMMKIQHFYHKLTLKARKALIKKNITKAKTDRREQQWQALLEVKPNVSTDDTVDVVAFEIATKTIGDFKLKSAETYRVPEDKRVTPTQKYCQMLCLQREIFKTKEDLNKKVCEIRNSKIWLVRRFKQMYHDLDVIQRELSSDLRKERLPVPKCYLKNNFPEHIFRLEFGADPTVYHPFSAMYDEAYHVLQLRTSGPVPSSLAQLSTMQWQHSFTFQWLQSLAGDDMMDTPWEQELKFIRVIRVLHEQDMIIKEMHAGVNNFDETLESLSIDRLKYARDVKLMEIFLLTLHQELIVINSYADREEDMANKINTCARLRNDKIQQKYIIQDTIEIKQQDIGLWQLKLTEIQEEVANLLTNNKFANFLNRIFKKKKAVKHSEDSESDSSSSEDTADEEIEDEDNDDFVPIKLDENVCPEGCEPAIFEEVINSRNLRYEIEETVADLRRQVDELQRELVKCTKELNKMEMDVQTTNEESEELQFEKQQKLNAIETVVVLNLSQFCHFVTPSHPEDGLVQNPLVFHSEALVTLAGRVRELHKETEAELLKIQQQKQLLQQLNKRRKEMREIRKNLFRDIDDEIMRKFGDRIDVEQMQEDVLKKMLDQARRDYQVDKLREKYDKVIADSKAKLWIHTKTLIEIEQENTRRLRLQTMLEQEALKLKELLRRQKVYKEKVVSLAEIEDFEKDMKCLETILIHQEGLNSELKEEIRKLSYKCTPPKLTKSVQRLTPEGGDALTELRVEEETIKYDENRGVANKTEELEVTQEDQISDKTIATIAIDTILYKLASGSSAYDIAVSIVEEMLQLSGDKEKKSSALECALLLVEELVQITVGEDSGDVALVEQYTDRLLAISKQSALPDLNNLDPSTS